MEKSWTIHHNVKHFLHYLFQETSDNCSYVKKFEKFSFNRFFFVLNSSSTIFFFFNFSVFAATCRVCSFSPLRRNNLQLKDIFSPLLLKLLVRLPAQKHSRRHIRPLYDIFGILCYANIIKVPHNARKNFYSMHYIARNITPFVGYNFSSLWRKGLRLKGVRKKKKTNSIPMNGTWPTQILKIKAPARPKDFSCFTKQN